MTEAATLGKAGPARAGALLAFTIVAGLALVSPAVGQTASADAGVLRWLDKLTGESADLELTRGQSATWGRLTVLLDDCRYPADNPASDAFAHLTIRDSSSDSTVFSGWMIASSPALSALDHPRYDVWVLACVYPEAPVQDAGEDTESGDGE